MRASGGGASLEDHCEGSYLGAVLIVKINSSNPVGADVPIMQSQGCQDQTRSQEAFPI